MEQASQQLRGTLARVGIASLNILQPGLGLLRLGRFRAAFGYIAAQLVGAGLLWLSYAIGPTWTFPGWLATVSVGVVAMLVLYLGSIAMTWRSSRNTAPRKGWLWRWYGIVLVWLGSLVVSSPINNPQAYYRTFWVPAESMAPELEVGDRFIAKMREFGALRRGDVVIVRKGKVEYVKRIVAIPGDKIMMESGQIVLNGHEVPQREASGSEWNGYRNPASETVLEEQLPGESRPHRVVDKGATAQDYWLGLVLGPDEFVLMGDNRDNSLDSRFPEASGGLDVVRRSEIEGRALFRFWRRGKGIDGKAI